MPRSRSTCVGREPVRRGDRGDQPPAARRREVRRTCPRVATNCRPRGGDRRATRDRSVESAAPSAEQALDQGQPALRRGRGVGQGPSHLALAGERPGDPEQLLLDPDELAGRLGRGEQRQKPSSSIASVRSSSDDQRALHEVRPRRRPRPARPRRSSRRRGPPSPRRRSTGRSARGATSRSRRARRRARTAARRSGAALGAGGGRTGSNRSATALQRHPTRPAHHFPLPASAVVDGARARRGSGRRRATGAPRPPATHRRSATRARSPACRPRHAARPTPAGARPRSVAEPSRGCGPPPPAPARGAPRRSRRPRRGPPRGCAAASARASASCCWSASSAAAASAWAVSAFSMPPSMRSRALVEHRRNFGST